MNDKIGILTFYNTTNYGALLQMYALYDEIKKEGYNVEIIRYYCDAVEKRENLKLYNLKNIKSIIRYLVLKIPNKKKKKKFHDFEQKYLQCSKLIYTDKTFCDIEKEYAKVIVGSDQVWNLQLTGNDLNFFLNGINNTKKLSYAASFGKEYLKNEEVQLIKPFLNNFDCLTVREISGVDIVNKITSKKAKFVLDPTFLLTSHEWMTLCENDETCSKPYILLYLIQNRKQTIHYAKKIAKKNGWEVKYINISPYHVNGVKNLRSISPSMFLSLINNAKLIITGSYHGLAFSINFNKPVFYEMHNGTNNYNARISSLVSTLQIEQCCLDYNCNDIPQLDYEVIQKKLAKMRSDSKKILSAMCQRSKNESN